LLKKRGEFSLNSSQVRGFNSWCKECYNSYAKTIKEPVSCLHCEKLFNRTGSTSPYCSIECALWSRVDIKSSLECWQWLGNVSADGYGSVTFNKKRYMPNRLSALLNGIDIPYNVKLICNTKNCCNPKHIIPKNAPLMDSNPELFKTAAKQLRHVNRGDFLKATEGMQDQQKVVDTLMDRRKGIMERFGV
jgi:hypothetical protein